VTVRGALRRALCASLLLCTQCDNHRQATAPAVAASSAPLRAPNPIDPLATTGVAALPASSSAARAPSVGRELVVPSSQIYEVADLKPGERRPLLIFLHGLGATGKVAFDVLHLAALGARERVFVVAPDGNSDREKRQFWNSGPSCCNFDHQPVDDVARLGALLEKWRARSDVDPARIYVAGHSNGGFMTERLACALGDRLAAAASLSGAAPSAEVSCSPISSLALLEVHGDADAIVRYEGGSVFDSKELAPYPSIRQGFQAWAQRFGCTGEPRHGAALDLDARLDGAETQVEEYANCARGSVALWTVHGGSHYVGTGTQAFEAVWRFLSAHHR
jgi:polyhydroxybutyrate depolymerase